jgi:LmbE family N-acetylglucosaminyl deacetylase
VRRARLPLEQELIPYEPGFPPGRRWLFLAPHPDDEAAGPAATLAIAHDRGVTAQVVFVTEGGAQGDAATREAEARASIGTLDLAPPQFWRFADRSLHPDDRSLRGAIRDALASFLPDALWLPSPVELHPDHRAIALAAQRTLRSWSAFGARRRPPHWVVCYEVGTAFQPNLLVAADAGWERKLRAVACHPSQLAVLPYDRVIEAFGTFRALTLTAVRRAEALHILPAREVVRLSARSWAAQMGSPRGVKLR